MTARPPALSLFAPEPLDNAPRYAGRPGHVESWFLRANDPRRPRAFWLKQTILAPLAGPAVAESWFIWFDGERGATVAQRVTQPLAQATFLDGRLDTRALSVRLGEAGSAAGALDAPEGRVDFELAFRPVDSPVARPLSVLPWKWLRVGPVPRAKALTPSPFLRFEGALRLPGETVAVDGWQGMQGHNWGKEHTFQYAWGQCLFPDDDAMVEGISARLKLGGRVTPWLSTLAVRKGARDYTFNHLVDVWRQEAAIDGDRWTLAMRGPAGEATLRMDASAQPMVCLGYDNPDGVTAFCFNSKLAAVELTVRPSDGASFTLKSAHGGALEFLRREQDPRFSRVV